MPATIFVALSLLAPLAILFPVQPERFRSGQEDDGRGGDGGDYVKFFTDPYYTRLLTTVRIAVWYLVSGRGFPWPMSCPTQSRWKHLLIISSCCRCSSATPCARPAGCCVSATRASQCEPMGLGLIDRRSR